MIIVEPSRSIRLLQSLFPLSYFFIYFSYFSYFCYFSYFSYFSYLDSRLFLTMFCSAVDSVYSIGQVVRPLP